ncbi:hypothetical protein CLAIMM_00985 [Cladophialophora immunda]|nr:hypothetical protein CLAIMM_00985 [Cladophialophora immunda]
MSSPQSDLTWMSSSELDELEAAIDVEEQFPVWQNSWTPINLSPQSATAALAFLPSSPADVDDDEAPSLSASHFREAVLSSALRIKQGRRGRKRKAPSTSPSSARKKRGVNASSKNDQNSAMLPDGNRLPPARTTRAVEKANSRRAESDDSLLPIRLNKLNIAASGHKRTSSEAFFADIEDLRAKKTLVMRGVGNGTASVATLLTEQQQEARMEPLRPRKKYHFSGADASNKDDREDHFNHDYTDVENFLETGNALAAKAIYPTPSPGRPETSTTLKLASSHTYASATVTHKPPMKPFIGTFLSAASLKATLPSGPLATFSALHPLPICFRIGEALRYVSSTFSSSRPTTPARAGTSFRTSNSTSLSLEIYAVMHSIHDNVASRTVTLADLFFPDRPPYLTGTIATQTTSGATIPASFPIFPKGALVRVATQISLRLASSISAAQGTSAPITWSSSSRVNTSASAAQKYDINVLRIDRSDWGEIQRVKTILDGTSGALAPAQSIPPVSTTGPVHQAEVAGRTVL